MSTVLLALAVTLATGVRTASEPATFWLDAHLNDVQQAEVIASAMERMARGTGRIERAARKEDADVLVTLRLGALRTERDGGTQSTGFGPEETAQVDATSTRILLDFQVLDLLSGETVFEQRVRCGLPLTAGTRLADPALRARLSHVVDVIDDWAKERPVDTSSATTFAPKLDGLDDAERARTLYREAERASLAGYQDAALTMLAEAQTVFKQTGLREEEGRAWEWLAALMATTGRPLDRSVTYGKQAVRIARQVSDPRAQARTLGLLAALEARNRNYPRALELLQAVRRQGREAGATLVETMAIANMAGLTAMRGKFESAHMMQAQALALAQQSGNPRAEGRVRLAMAVTAARTDERDRTDTLAQLVEVARLAAASGDRALAEDVAFVQANVRLGTTNLGQLRAGEIDAIRALKLARRLEDQQGEAAALALLGAFAHRLERLDHAAEYLALAQEKAREAGYVEIMADSLQLLGEMAPSYERGLTFLDNVLLIQRETNDVRREIKTLSDMVRLHAGLGENDAAWARYQGALGALDRYVGERNADPFAEDIEESFITVLKSLVATRTELPFLGDYLELQHLLVIPNPGWVQGGS